MTANTPPAAPGAVDDDGQDAFEGIDPIAAAYSRGWIDGAFLMFVGALLLAIIVFGMRGLPW